MGSMLLASKYRSHNFAKRVSKCKCGAVDRPLLPALQSGEFFKMI